MELVRVRRARRIFCCHDRSGDGASARFASLFAGAVAAIAARSVLLMDLAGSGASAWVIEPDGGRVAYGETARPPDAAGLAALARHFPYVVVATDERMPLPQMQAAMRACDRVLYVVRDVADLAAWHTSPDKAAHAMLLPLGLPRMERETDVHRWPVAPATGDALVPVARLALERIVRRELGMAVGLVLGGGAARGFAHFGVLRVLEQAGIAWDMMGGTSGGGYVSAFRAMGKTIDEAYAICVRETVDRNPLADVTLPVTALTRGKVVSRAVQRAFGSTLVEDLPIDFFVVASDLVAGTPAILDHGSLGEACLASATLPGIFPPVRRGRMLLVDGGLMQNVPGPVMKARGADLVIAVDLSSERDVPFDAPGTETQPKGWLPKLLRRSGGMRDLLEAPRIIPILMRSLEILMQSAVRGNLWSFDVHIRPQVGGFGMLSWKDHLKLEERGRMAAESQLPALEREIAALRARVQAEVDAAIDAPAQELTGQGF